MSPQGSCQISCPSSITHLFITPRYVVAATHPGTVVVLEIACNHHNLENDPHKRIIEAGTMRDIDWNDSFLVTGNDDGTARLWSAENGVKLKEFPGHGDSICAVRMPDNSTIITGTGDGTHTIRVWDVASGSCLHELDRHSRAIKRLETISNRLISVSNDQTVRIWDLATGNQLHQLEGHAPYPHIFGFNDNKTLMAVTCSGSDIKIWRIQDGACVATCHGHTWVANQLENRNGNLVSASADGTIRTWNWEDGSLLHAIDPAHQPISNRTNAICGMTWTNLYMITGGFRDGLVKVWNKDSNMLISEHRVVNPAIWHLVGGEGKVAIASKAGDELYQITLWDKGIIDVEGL